MTTPRAQVPLKQFLIEEGARLNLTEDGVWYRLRRYKKKYYPQHRVIHLNQRVVFVIQP